MNIAYYSVELSFLIKFLFENTSKSEVNLWYEIIKEVPYPSSCLAPVLWAWTKQYCLYA